jgi:hypothetical protein
MVRVFAATAVAGLLAFSSVSAHAGSPTSMTPMPVTPIAEQSAEPCLVGAAVAAIVIGGAALLGAEELQFGFFQRLHHRPLFRYRPPLLWALAPFK